jgi:hypothetical protein
VAERDGLKGVHDIVLTEHKIAVRRSRTAINVVAERLPLNPFAGAGASCAAVYLQTPHTEPRSTTDLPSAEYGG